MRSRRRLNTIPAYPRLRVGDLYGRGMKAGLFRTFYGKEALLFYLGRGAVFHAIKMLALAEPSTILVPSYHCGVEIEAVRMAGAGIRYYRVQKNMDVDIADLRRNIDANTRAVMVTHYFGFPQPIDEIGGICHENDLFLIEDCAHALLSSCRGRALGSFGALSVFSQRKSLPIPDGGALLVNDRSLPVDVHLTSPNRLVTAKQMTGMLCRSLVDRGRSGVRLPLVGAVKQRLNRAIRKQYGSTYSTSTEVDLGMCRLSMSAMSNGVMNRSKVEDVVRRRRANFEYLLERCPPEGRIERVRQTLPDGVCPLFFPVRVQDVPRRELQESMRQRGIETFVFGEELHRSLPVRAYPVAQSLSSHLLCLPVHQTLEARDLERIGDALNSA